MIPRRGSARHNSRKIVSSVASGPSSGRDTTPCRRPQAPRRSLPRPAPRHYSERPAARSSVVFVEVGRNAFNNRRPRTGPRFRPAASTNTTGLLAPAWKAGDTPQNSGKQRAPRAMRLLRVPVGIAAFSAPGKDLAIPMGTDGRWPPPRIALRYADGGLPLRCRRNVWLSVFEPVSWQTVSSLADHHCKPFNRAEAFRGSVRRPARRTVATMPTVRFHDSTTGRGTRCPQPNHRHGYPHGRPAIGLPAMAGVPVIGRMLVVNRFMMDRRGSRSCQHRRNDIRFSCLKGSSRARWGCPIR